MRIAYFCFIAAAVAALCGMSLGLFMGMREDFTLESLERQARAAKGFKPLTEADAELAPTVAMPRYAAPQGFDPIGEVLPADGPLVCMQRRPRGGLERCRFPARRH